MIRSTTFAGRRVAVFGLGSSGNACALALQAGGADVVAWDDGEAGRASAAAAGIPLCDLSTADWSEIAALVLAPGVPLTHPTPHWSVLRARAETERRSADQGPPVEIIGDIELFCRERDAFNRGVHNSAPFIAITGTNGKSTTTALIAHILSEAGRDVQMGGNIGVPILDLEPLAADRFYVIEMSSFQIDLTPSLAPLVGVLLNITPDHLDRHGTLWNYARIKSRLIENAILPVVGTDAARMLADIAEVDGRPLPFDEGDLVSGREDAAVCVHDGQLKTGPGLATVFDLRGVGSLRGSHNGENAAAAFAALQTFLPGEDIARHMRTFPGLPHRLEELGTLDAPGGCSVLVINDSKATNADSTEKALQSFDGAIHWIVGGKPKEGGIESLRPYFGKISRAYLIGAATEAFAATLDGHVPYERCETLAVATTRAASAAVAAAQAELSAGVVGPAPVVLLSPACASFDQFANFEKRGDAFADAVAHLPGFVPRSAVRRRMP